MERLYVVVRSDLPLGDQLAQTGHAVASFSAHAHELFTAWHGGANNLVVLSARDELHLGELRERVLATTDAVVVDVHEPDMDDERTAIAFAGTRAAARVVSNLPLAPAVRRAA